MAARKGPNRSQHSKVPKIARRPLVTDDRGRPIYDPSFHPLAAKRQTLLGSMDAELAEDFGISLSLYYNWRKTYPEFDQAIRRAKRLADGEVAEALHGNALGRVVRQEKVVVTKDGVEVIEYRQSIPPDTRAASHWLAARNPGTRGLNGRRADSATADYDEARALASLDAMIDGAKADRAAQGLPPIPPSTPAEQAANRVAIAKLVGPVDRL
jgi:hypothetical protein